MPPQHLDYAEICEQLERIEQHLALHPMADDGERAVQAVVLARAVIEQLDEMATGFGDLTDE